MLKPSTISVAMETAQAEKAHKLIDSLLSKMKAYNKEVSKSNRLLQDQERLRRELGISVKKGIVYGLIKKEGNHGNNEQGKKTN